MKQSIGIFISGLIVTLAAIWGGFIWGRSYEGTWLSDPGIFSAIIIGVFGLYTATYGLIRIQWHVEFRPGKGDLIKK